MNELGGHYSRWNKWERENTIWYQLYVECKQAELIEIILWLCHVMSWLIGKDPDAGKHWRQEKGMASLTQWTWVWANCKDGEGQSNGVAKSWIWLSNWTTTAILKQRRNREAAGNLSSVEWGNSAPPLHAARWKQRTRTRDHLRLPVSGRKLRHWKDQQTEAK